MTQYLNPSTRSNGAQQIVVAPTPAEAEVTEAPIDNNQYARVNGDWQPASTSYPEFAVEGVGDPPAGFVIYGTEFNDWIAALPKGIVASAYFGSNWTSPALNTQGEVGIGEISFTQEEGRNYKVTFNGAHLSASGGRASGLFKLRYTNDGSAPLVTSAVGDSIWIDVPDGEANTCPPMMPSGTWGPPDSTIRVLLTWQRYYGAGDLFLRTYVGNSYQKPFRIYVEDIGLDVPDVWNGSYGGNDYSAAAPPTPPVLKTYTKTFTSTTACCYMGNGSKDSSQGAEDMKQGYSSYDGQSESIWIFPPFTGPIGAAEITKVRLYLYANHWNSYSGGTALIKRHNYGSVPPSNPSQTTVVSKSGWPRPAGLWVDITNASGVKAGIIGDTIKGFGVGPATSTSGTYYGRFNKAGAKVEITYKR